jgi:hypothetical protein
MEDTMKQKFINHKFTADSLSMIETINGILEEYKAMGFRLSLRQVYYQLVARDYIPNSLRSYKRIGELVAIGRTAGLIDWEMIEDRNRDSVANTHWTSPAQIIRAAAEQFKVDRWEGQRAYVEVMVEKDALSGILLPTCRSLDVRFSANKGYSSASAMYEAGRRFRKVAFGQNSVAEYHLFYLGDHDPSGIDMTRDVRERLRLFCDLPQVQIEVHRLALNIDQVHTWNPPENPAKETDSRYTDYASQFGEACWELDAVEPRTLARLLETQILKLIDDKIWQKVAKQEARMKADLMELAEEYESEHE